MKQIHCSHVSVWRMVLAALFLLPFCVCEALDCQFHKSHSGRYKAVQTITVSNIGHANFNKIQSAIDAVPDHNTMWIRIMISPGQYREKVVIPVKKTCIYLHGSGRNSTSIEWGDHIATSSSSTFTSYADNIVVKGIAFKNTYNGEGLVVTQDSRFEMRQAVSARINGDKCAFFRCGFHGVQDTFWDEKGRHYFLGCYFEGAVDFIFGRAQSVYEKCKIYVNIDDYAPGLVGYITAQKKEFPLSSSGFVFKNCTITGKGKAYLGRAWGKYSTVVIADSKMSDVVDPRGWHAWDNVGYEEDFTYVELRNRGPGAETSKRVPWLKKLQASQINRFLDLSYINQGNWLANIPRVKKQTGESFYEPYEDSMQMMKLKI